jgi:hypothetical protein
MSSGRKTVTLFLTVILGLLLAAVALVAGWPGWTWPVMAVLVVTVPPALARATGRPANPVPLDLAGHLPMTPVERLEQRVSQVTLPSSWDDYDFRFAATVRWCPTGCAAEEPVINPGGLAVDAILARAREITQRRSPGRASLVQHELNGVLGRMRPDSTGYLRVMAEMVVLTLPEPDQERLDRLSSVRKNEAVWEHERKYEQSKREYLGDDVLTDTGSAVVWWLARNEDHVEKTVNDIGLLAQLASAANNQDVPGRFQHLVPHPAPVGEPAHSPFGEPPFSGQPGAGGPFAADPESDESEEMPLQEPEPTAADHFDEFLRAMDFAQGDPQRALLAKRMANLLFAHQRWEEAQDLLRRFDASPESGDGAESPDATGSAESAPDAAPPGPGASDVSDASDASEGESPA